MIDSPSRGRPEPLALGVAFAAMVVFAGAAIPARADVYRRVNADGAVRYEVDRAPRRIETRLAGRELRVAEPYVAPSEDEPAVELAMPTWELDAQDPTRDLLPGPLMAALKSAPTAAPTPPVAAAGLPQVAGAVTPSTQKPLSAETRAAIEDLERQIAEERGALKTLISSGRDPSAPLVNDPQVREIGERLTRLHAELARLREPRPPPRRREP